MKILIFRQPFPMGNYRLNEYIGQKLSEEGHQVYCVQQISCNFVNDTIQKIIDTYVSEIKALDPDVVYFEMLDQCTFKVVEQLSCHKVLCFASKGILPDHNEIFYHVGSWYDTITTNSFKLYKEYRGVLNIHHWTYYPAPIVEEELQTMSMYQCEMCFLGQGHHRMTNTEYDKERKLFFNNDNIDKQIYGDGWKRQSGAKGLLPKNHIGALYKSANAGFALINGSQRSMGQINNRYSELAFCECPIFSVNYDTIDWYGAEKFINFPDSPQQMTEMLKDQGALLDKASAFKTFIDTKEQEFFSQLRSLIEA